MNFEKLGNFIHFFVKDVLYKISCYNTFGLIIELSVFEEDRHAIPDTGCGICRINRINSAS